MQEDTEGWDVELRYFRDIDKQEVDFVITEDEKRFNSSKDVGINLISVVRGLIFTFYSPPTNVLLKAAFLISKTSI